MTRKEAEKIQAGDKVTVKDYFGQHKVVRIQVMGSRIGFWLDNGDLVNHKRIEKVVREEGE